MQIEIKIDNSYQEPKVILLTDKMSEVINTIIRKLSEEAPQILTGFREETLEILEQSEVIRIYAAAHKNYAVTDKGEYLLRLRLYDLEEQLDKNSFVRISNSEIINLKKVKRFDLSFSGSICVTLSNEMVTFVSRRFVEDFSFFAPVSSAY